MEGDSCSDSSGEGREVVADWVAWSSGVELAAAASTLPSSPPTTSTFTLIPSTGTPLWHSGMRSLVFFTAIMAATRATARTSPFLRACARTSGSGV